MPPEALAEDRRRAEAMVALVKEMTKGEDRRERLLRRARDQTSRYQSVHGLPPRRLLLAQVPGHALEEEPPQAVPTAPGFRGVLTLACLTHTQYLVASMAAKRVQRARGLAERGHNHSIGMVS